MGVKKRCLPWNHSWIRTGRIGRVTMSRCAICGKERTRVA